MPWCPDLLKPEQLQHTGHMEPSITGCHGYPYGSFCCLAAVQSMKERGAACPHGKAWLLLRLRQVWALRTKQAAWNNREVKNLTLLLIYNMLSRDAEKSCPLKPKTKTSKRAPHPALRYDPKYTKATASISNVMLWLESSGVPGLPKPSSSCSLAMTILVWSTSVMNSAIKYSQRTVLQYSGREQQTSNFLNSNTIHPKEGEKKKKVKKRLHTALSVISTFQTASEIIQIYQRSCQPTHVVLEADHVDMFPTQPAAQYMASEAAPHRICSALSWDVHDNIEVCPPA